MHPVHLHFEPSLEREFAEEYFQRTLQPVRFAVLLALVLYTAFGILDVFVAPEQRRALWTIRYGIVAPLLLACFAFTYTAAYRRHYQKTLAGVILVAGLGIVVMTSIIPPPGSYLYYAGLLLAITFVFTLVRLNVLYSTGVSTLIVVAYIVVAMRLSRTTPVLIVNNLFFLVSATIIGFMANYTMERYARANFLQRRVIQRRTRELESTNEELRLKNHLLAESRAATLRSERRTDLIFAALTDALPGTVLDNKYRVEDKIGSGNFGTVYRGEHILLHHPVAIKIFRPAIGTAALDSLDRFRIEGISACRVDHPNAVTVLDFDVSGGSLAYLVMELLRGHSLADELRRVGRLPAQRAVFVAAVVCDVLAEAHRAGIVHRDIKPSNVFLHQGREHELVKVIDFGIAKLTGDAGSADVRATSTGTFVGSPAYTAPERLSRDAYDGRADVYSVGVMLYEMLTGDLPYRVSADGYWSAQVHAAGGPLPPSRTDADVPTALDEIVMGAMAREASGRPSAAELASQLRALTARR